MTVLRINTVSFNGYLNEERTVRPAIRRGSQGVTAAGLVTADTVLEKEEAAGKEVEEEAATKVARTAARVAKYEERESADAAMMQRLSRNGRCAGSSDLGQGRGRGGCTPQRDSTR